MSASPALDGIIYKIQLIAKESGKLTGFCIGNTRKIDFRGFYFSPIRQASRVVAGSAIVYSELEAVKIAKAVDGRVDYIFIDTEKKINLDMWGSDGVGNIERAIRENVTQSLILTYKGNDLTVDALDCLISQVLSTHPRGISGKRAAIIGAGNIGAKLALKLVERGMSVSLSRRDKIKLLKIVDALNIIKPLETIATVSAAPDNASAVEGADLVLGLSQGTPVITADMVDKMAPSSILIDGGKGCCELEAVQRAKERGIEIYRADIRSSFEGHTSMILEMELMLKENLGRSNIDGIPIVAAGMLGYFNEIIVDKINKPTVAFGVADGRGDFVRNLSPEQELSLDIVKKFCEKSAK